MISPRPIGNTVFTNHFKNLRSGDRINLKAIKPLENGVWQVSFKGKLLTVTSNIQLQRGKMYSGRMFWQGNTLFFKTETALSKGKMGIISPENPPEKMLISVLQQLHMPVDQKMLQWIFQRAGEKKNDIRILRLIAQLYDRGIDIQTMDADLDLIYIFPEGERKDSDRQKKDQNPPKNRREIKDAIKQTLKAIVKRRNDSSLGIFNHLKAGHDHWITIPIGLIIDGEEINGALRCKIDKNTTKIDAFSLIIEIDEQQMCFFFPNWKEKNSTCRIFSDKPLSLEMKEKFLPGFYEKLTKLGLKIDDTINSERNFDGFEELPNKGFKTVDTVI